MVLVVILQIYSSNRSIIESSGTVQSDNKVMNYLTVTQKKELEKEASTIQLTMWNPDAFQINILDIFTDLMFVKSERRHGQPHERALIEKTGKHASLAEILSVIKSIDSCKVLITSKEEGMGKTTLLRYIAYNWATNKSDNIFADKLVFFIDVRDIKSGKTILDVIVQHIQLEYFSLKTNLPKDPNIIKQFILEHNNKLVLLFDGLDELESGAESPIRIFKGLVLSESTVILTSRPEHAISFISSSDVNLKVEGFSPSNIKQYIRKHFTYIDEPELGRLLIEAFKLNSPFEMEWGGYYKAVFKLCSSPFLLLKICTIWTENQYLPADLTDLYKEVFCCILNQYINRSGKDDPIKSFKKIPMKYTSAILALGGTIYKGLQINVLSIDKDDITEANDKESVNLGLELGFVYKEKLVNKGDFIKRYKTPHKLLSEALAGFYLSYKIQQGSLDADECEMIRSNEYLHMTKVFAIGFLGKKAAGLMKHWLMIDASNLYSLAKYFSYVKKEHMKSVIKALDTHIMSKKMKIHIENMTRSFRRFINGTETEHLVELMLELCDSYNENEFLILNKVESIINESSEEHSENICRMVAHISIILQLQKVDVKYSEGNDQYLINIVQKWGNKALRILSTEWEEYHVKNEIHTLVFANMSSISGEQLCEVLRMVPNLNVLKMVNCRLSGKILMTMITECQHSQVLLELEYLYISYNNFSDTEGKLLAHLLKKPKKLQFVDMKYCNLTSNIVGDMLQEFDVISRGTVLDLANNNFMNIGDELSKKLKRISEECDHRNVKMIPKIKSEISEHIAGAAFKASLQTGPPLSTTTRIKQRDQDMFKLFFKFYRNGTNSL